MITEKQIEDDFLLSIVGKKNLKTLRKSYKQELDILDEFFTIFTEKVDLDPTTPDTPEWVLYNQKYKEYELYADAINRIDRYAK